jgi:solute carrier family 25 citrate transporter 1
VHCASTIVRQEGLRGLWSGATPTICRNGTNQMCLFWAKHNVDHLLWNKQEGDGRVLTPWQSMASGFSAALLGPVATGPFDVAKTRMMAQDKLGGTLKYKVGCCGDGGAGSACAWGVAVCVHGCQV